MLKLKFSPLFYEDGSVCRFRVGCLAAAACCAVMHVALKAVQEESYTTAAAEISSLQVSGSESYASSGILRINTISSSVPAETTERSAVNSDLTGELSVAGQSEYDDIFSSEEIHDKSFVSEIADSIGRLFGDKESEEKKRLLSVRKQALSELKDSVGFLSACGNINAGYMGCSYKFSDMVNANYHAGVESADDGFIVTLEAKGSQMKDPCRRFVVSSEGFYAAYNINGNSDSKCFVDNMVPLQGSVSLPSVAFSERGSAAPSGLLPFENELMLSSVTHKKHIQLNRGPYK